MRIIAGTFRRRVLKEVMSASTRSTKDRVKESLFNMLTPLSHYENVLDVFAGSGALGLEALSRGAKTVTFIEREKEAFQVLKDNIHTLLVHQETTLYFDDSFRVMSQLKTAFDLIILDPPYLQGLIPTALDIIEKERLLSEAGTIVVLSSKEEHIEPNARFHVLKQKTYGLTKVTLMKWSE